MRGKRGVGGPGYTMVDLNKYVGAFIFKLNQSTSIIITRKKTKDNCASEPITAKGKLDWPRKEEKEEMVGKMIKKQKRIRWEGIRENRREREKKEEEKKSEILNRD